MAVVPRVREQEAQPFLRPEQGPKSSTGARTETHEQHLHFHPFLAACRDARKRSDRDDDGTRVDSILHEIREPSFSQLPSMEQIFYISSTSIRSSDARCQCNTVLLKQERASSTVLLRSNQVVHISPAQGTIQEMPRDLHTKGVGGNNKGV